MQRNFDTILKTLDGVDFTQKPSGKPLTLKAACIEALGADLHGDAALDGQKKYELWALAGRIHQGGVVDVTAEEIATIKTRLSGAWPIFVVGAAYAVLEEAARPAPPAP